MSFQITILGSSGALPAYGRYPSAQFVSIENRHFLVDCGEAVQMQLMKFQIHFHRINQILISHLHGDHYLGLMGLLFTMHLQRRTNDLHLHGPAGLDEIVTVQLKHAMSVPGYRIIYHCFDHSKPSVIFEDDHLTVETIPLVHRIPCCGFLFKEKAKPRRIDKAMLPSDLKLQQLAALKRGDDVLDDAGRLLHRNKDLTLAPRKSRSYAYCSDTAYNEGMLAQIANVDLLYHEATFGEDERAKAEATCHSTASQAATIASKANAGQLLLGHYSARYKDLEPILQEARSIFPNSRLSVEGEVYSLQE